MTEASYKIRAATPDDADAVTAILAASYPTLLAGWYESEFLARSLPLMTRANPKLLTSSTYYVAAFADGHLVACGGWTPDEPGTGKVIPGLAHIRHFATHPDWTRRGIAGGMLRHSLEEAKARGVERLDCFSTRPAESFYRGHGFATVGPVDVPLTDEVRLPSILMRRDLP